MKCRHGFLRRIRIADGLMQSPSPVAIAPLG
jgi:hypothetical protein